ncbi:Replicase [Sesbania bispinosa]|nr:Replicase [Sesbania bispinosa]
MKSQRTTFRLSSLGGRWLPDLNTTNCNYGKSRTWLVVQPKTGWCDGRRWRMAPIDEKNGTGFWSLGRCGRWCPWAGALWKRTLQYIVAGAFHSDV